MSPKNRDILLHDQSPIIITFGKLNIDKIFYKIYSPYSDFPHYLSDVRFSSEGYVLRPSDPRDGKLPRALMSVHLRTRSILCNDELIFHECS